MGKIDAPFYRIVALDSRKKRDGIYLESLGYYDPKTDPLTLKVDIEKAIKWLEKGAQPSDTVKSLFRKSGVMEKWHIMKFGEKSVTKKTIKKVEKKEKMVEKKTAKKEKVAEKEEVQEKKTEEKIATKETEK